MKPVENAYCAVQTHLPVGLREEENVFDVFKRCKVYGRRTVDQIVCAVSEARHIVRKLGNCSPQQGIGARRDFADNRRALFRPFKKSLQSFQDWELESLRVN